MTGVLIVFEALMISLIRGTPCVILMPATPAKWKVFRVICVPGSPIDCAAIAPTADPGSTLALSYFSKHARINAVRVGRDILAVRSAYSLASFTKLDQPWFRQEACQNLLSTFERLDLDQWFFWSPSGTPSRLRAAASSWAFLIINSSIDCRKSRALSLSSMAAVLRSMYSKPSPIRDLRANFVRRGCNCSLHTDIISQGSRVRSLLSHVVALYSN